MPELPEVEAVRRVIEPQVKGRTVEAVEVNRPDVIAHPFAETFADALAGQTFVSVKRRGKYLAMHLASGDRLIVHLRMTGCLLVVPADCPKERHTHVVFRLDDGRDLRFSDARRFGRLWLVRKGEPDVGSGMEKLGPEPFDPDFSAAYLIDRLGRRKRAIKECLLDQGVVAGIGNIYADEILFEARIHPGRPASSLTEREWDRLATIVPKRLMFFIEKSSMTPEEYAQSKGQDYRNTPFLQVYGREGEPCPVCGTLLRRVVVGGRGSVFCPACQREKQ